MTQFFLFCSGVQNQFIKRSPSEVNKYVGIGAAVFFTGVLAFLSSAYAFFTVFKSYTAAIFLGLLWGLMVFNLDRYIVSSIKKTGSGLNQFFMAFPRIIFACLIAIVISKPIELKLFDSEINAELVSMEQEVYKHQEDLVRNRYSADIGLLQNGIQELQGRIKTKEVYKNQLLTEAIGEADGTGGSQIRNMGPIYKMKKQEADLATVEFNNITAEIQPLIDEKGALLSEFQDNEQKAIEELKLIPLDGFASRLDALSNLANEKSSIFWASLFITLLFIALETAPVFVKLISSKGPLDYVQNKHENYFVFSHDLALSDLAMKKQYHQKTYAFATTKVIEEENKLFKTAIENEVNNIGNTLVDISFYQKWKRNISKLFFNY